MAFPTQPGPRRVGPAADGGRGPRERLPGAGRPQVGAAQYGKEGGLCPARIEEGGCAGLAGAPCPRPIPAAPRAAAAQFAVPAPRRPFGPAGPPPRRYISKAGRAPRPISRLVADGSRLSVLPSPAFFCPCLFLQGHGGGGAGHASLVAAGAASAGPELPPAQGQEERVADQREPASGRAPTNRCGARSRPACAVPPSSSPPPRRRRLPHSCRSCSAFSAARLALRERSASGRCSQRRSQAAERQPGAARAHAAVTHLQSLRQLLTRHHGPRKSQGGQLEERLSGTQEKEFWAGPVAAGVSTGSAALPPGALCFRVGASLAQALPDRSARSALAKRSGFGW